MFNLLKDITPTYKWPVKFNIAADGGKLTTIKFDVEFNRISDDKIKGMLDSENENRLKNDTDMLAEIVVSVSAKDEAGQYGEINDSEYQELLEVPGISKAIVTAFFQSRTGEKAKN